MSSQAARWTEVSRLKLAIRAPRVGDEVWYIGVRDGTCLAAALPAVVTAVRGTVVDLRVSVAGGFTAPRTFDRFDVDADPVGVEDCWRWTREKTKLKTGRTHAT